MTRRWIAVAAVALLAACDTPTDLEQRTFEWFGTMAMAEGFEHLEGEAVMTFGFGDSHLVAGAAVWGDEVGTVRPWHVHHSTCAAGGGIVGADGDYPRLVTDAEGQAVVITDVPVTIDPDEAFHVNVHLSEEEMGTIIACADLMPLN